MSTYSRLAQPIAPHEIFGHEKGLLLLLLLRVGEVTKQLREEMRLCGDLRVCSSRNCST